ncbi:hypothetical protein L228DRAFT_248173 [Xylona heveae TC161]|uniref:Uncharacterized protein n=1 Tax=Xylona heveae (strain CBS 132557 / TC161) TaxID=1328760 RepID=A0A165FWD8_XYLHT|nr:hypothetical protein L228DRAFT_248173 [Xylona heveae TC161]KZF21461.1 hypothetical protein L228DRAFT_248173 [Xylona heveae TC161]
MISKYGSSPFLVLILCSSFIVPLHAQSSAPVIGDNLVGCDQVGCPQANYDTQCSVADETYHAIGVASHRTPFSTENITWTVAQQMLDQGSAEHPQTIRKEFYFGSTPGFSLMSKSSPYEGCALFFPDFDPPDNPLFNSSSCNSTLGSTCVQALYNQATTFLSKAQNNETSLNICNALGTELRENAPLYCQDSAGRNSTWETLDVRPLTGSNASSPISFEQNATSNCWPTLPKRNELRPMFSYNLSGQAIASAVNRITPILTVFFSSDKAHQDNILSHPDGNFLCLKPMESMKGAQPNQALSLGKGVETMHLGTLLVAILFFLM